MVRLTREALFDIAWNRWLFHKSEYKWFVITAIEWNMVFNKHITSRSFRKYELIPEEPEFEFWGEIEVRDEMGAGRKRVIFLCKTTANDTHQYITADISKKSFNNGARFHNNAWRFARKAPPQLTRKEIAEKFWVSEDFIFCRLEKEWNQSFNFFLRKKMIEVNEKFYELLIGLVIGESMVLLMMLVRWIFKVAKERETHILK